MKYKIVCINKRYYRLYHAVGSQWRLFYEADRQTLNIDGAHMLDYWRRKGVIDGEEEKKNKGS